MFRNKRRRHGKARKGNWAIENWLRLRQRDLHESMGELGKAGRRENRWGWKLDIVITVTKTVIIGWVAEKNGHQVVLILTLESGAEGMSLGKYPTYSGEWKDMESGGGYWEWVA
jgi:hypothetical protein